MSGKGSSWEASCPPPNALPAAAEDTGLELVRRREPRRRYMYTGLYNEMYFVVRVVKHLELRRWLAKQEIFLLNLLM